MGRKDIIVYKLVSAQSLAATFNSSPTVINYMDNCSYQINVTTSNSQGTFSVQASNDYKKDEPSQIVTNAGTWVDLTLSGTPTVAAANDSIIINLNQLPFTAIRLHYTSTIAGTGTADIYITDKVVGA